MSDPSLSAPSLDTLACASFSDAGRVRAENQDSAGVVRNTSGERLLVVADGMGGHLGGETASRMCLELLERCFRDPHGSPEERLRRGLVLANEEIYSHALANPELRGMGTTAVALLLSPGVGAWVAWVGDSRAYRLRNGELEPLTRDHSLMAEWISLGVLTAEAAETHPRRHELTRALGQSPDVAVDTVAVDVCAGDRFLLCSDGLHGYVPERALRSVLGEGEAEHCARTLIERANANGGSDNVSVVVAVVPVDAAPVAEPPPPEIDALIALDSPPPPPAEPAPDLGPLHAPPPTPSEPVGSLTFAASELPRALAAEDAPAEAPHPPPAPAPAPALAPKPELDASLTFAELSFGDELTPPEDAPEPILAPTTRVSDAAESLSFGEISFNDVLSGNETPADAPAEAPAAAVPAAAVPPKPAPPPAPAPQLPLLDPPVAPREIRIPRMTPVRASRALDARSLLVGMAATLLVAALAGGAWLYTGSRQEPAPEPPRPRPQARPIAPAPRAAPPVAPRPAPRPEIAEVAPPQIAKLPPPPAPVVPAAPVAPTPPPVAPPPPRPVARPSPAVPPPAAPDPAGLASTAGFELPPPVSRFVDDWLRAVSTHDARRLAALGLRGAPDELAGSFATRDGFKLVAASIDEERSHDGRWFVRLVVSYAFRDATGRFRTQDEQRWILRDVGGGALRYEGRWQQ